MIAAACGIDMGYYSCMEKDKTSYRILQILNDGQFHSDEVLGEKLKITRSAIWKGVQQLQITYGIAVESSSLPGHGYRLKEPLNLLDREKILQEIDANKQAQIRVILLNQTNSTNDYLLTYPDLSSDIPYAVVLAEQQLHGRGRQGRHWVSPYGHNIYFSLAWHCHKDLSELSGLSLATAIAVIRALKKYGITSNLYVKWPNDILYGHDKLAGILLDIKTGSSSTSTVIIGIGINTFLPPDFAKTIDQPWTSLNDILHKPINRNHLTSLLINAVIDMLSVFENLGFLTFLTEWNEHDSLIGQPIIISQGDTKIAGVMQGITEHGELLVKNTQQQLQTFISGDVSLRRQ